jgi:DNA (cytosine-5)-methyltransferase 1
MRNIYTLKDVNEASNKKLFNVVSLFAGVGGSSTGYRLAGGNILAINEFIPKAYESYRRNYPNTHIFEGDIRKLNGDIILNTIGLKKGELDILDGSPPCASFSTAGLREDGWGKVKKYSDTKQRVDDLFYEFARILKELQPKVFIAENVKGLTMGAAANLLGNEQFSIFGDEDNTIFHTLVNCGYKVKYKVLNAMNYGVPQSRERTIFIGIRNDFNIPITYPKKFDYLINAKDAFEGIKHEQNEIDEATYKDGKVKGILLQMSEGDSGNMYSENKNSYFGLVRINRNKPCPTVCQRQGNKGACLAHWEENRELTIKELIRIMSFPEDYYLGEKYKDKCERLGRAVPPLLMKAIANHVYETILKPINNVSNSITI